MIEQAIFLLSQTETEELLPSRSGFVNATSTFVFQAPGWVYLACAVGLFVYQSLDAIDGKQARRTQSNTPLGELFDHGCDSLSTGMYTLVCFEEKVNTNT